MSVFNSFKSVINYVGFQPHPVFVQNVRWRRKPLWMPTAKSKLFRIPPRPQIPLDEKLELQRLNNNYRTHMKSIKRYLTETYNVKYSPSANVEQLKEDFEADFARCNEINKEWNEAIRIHKEQRVQKQTEEFVEKSKIIFEERKRLEELQLQQAEEEIRRQKEAAKTFITPDNLESAIEFAINNPADYNFAIDLNGNKILGRNTKPDTLENKSM